MDNGPLEEKARKVRSWWFDGLPEVEQDAIIKPHFDDANPERKDVEKVVKEYEKDMVLK